MSLVLVPAVRIPAQGSSSRKSSRVDLVVVHTAEGSKDVESLGRYFARTRAGSSHGGVGQDGEYAEYVSYGRTAWTNPPANARSDTVELCAFARWSRAQWLDHEKMLDTTARWIAWRCAVRGVPLRKLTAEQVADGKRGVCGHVDVSHAFRRSTHTDPGPSFPWDVVMAAAARHAGVKAAVATAPRQRAKAGGSAEPPFPGTLRRGSTGPGVVLLQKRLVNLGNALRVDGDFGPGTEAVVRIAQRNRHLTVDGVVGPKTWAALW